MAHAYVRRKQYEARLLAAEISRIFAGTGTRGPGRQPAANGRVSPDEMLEMMGVSF